MDRKPYKISSRIKECLSMSALSVLQKKCNGRSKCSFTVYKDEFLSKASKCNKNTTLLFYYTCKTPTLGMEIIISCVKAIAFLLEMTYTIQMPIKIVVQGLRGSVFFKIVCYFV